MRLLRRSPRQPVAPGRGAADAPTAEPAATAEFDARADDAGIRRRLARVHLRTGSFELARSELESLAGRRQLDPSAMLDLAEARWRTGHLVGAGEAARAYLASGGGEALGYVIAAESSADLGRLELALSLLDRAALRRPGGLDSIYAGMPTRMPPAEASVPAVDVPAAALSGPSAREQAHEPASPAADAAPSNSRSGAPVEPGSAGPQLWGHEAGAIAAGRAELEAGHLAVAAVHLGVALRADPDSAASILEAIGERHDAGLELVRGDALRLLGREAEAVEAFAAAASALTDPARPSAQPGRSSARTNAPLPGSPRRKSANPERSAPA